MTILPLAYLPPAEWFAHLAAEECVIDLGENWVKQSVRNHCEIMTSGGPATLTVPVHGGSGGVGGGVVSTRDIRIDNSRNWQHRHWLSLVSAYRNSPYFDHYQERFAPLYTRKIEFLADLNLSLLDILTSITGLAGRVKISEEYVVAAPVDLDLRGKKAFRRSLPAQGDPKVLHAPHPTEYTQVFSSTVPFVGGLSVVDLLFCEGPRIMINGLMISD